MPGNEVTALRDWTEIDTSTDGKVSHLEIESEFKRISRMISRAGQYRQFNLANSLETIEKRLVKIAKELEGSKES